MMMMVMLIIIMGWKRCRSKYNMIFCLNRQHQSSSAEIRENPTTSHRKLIATCYDAIKLITTCYDVIKHQASVKILNTCLFSRIIMTSSLVTMSNTESYLLPGLEKETCRFCIHCIMHHIKTIPTHVWGKQ